MAKGIGPLLLIGGAAALLLAGRKRPSDEPILPETDEEKRAPPREKQTMGGPARPPNTSGDPEGYNSDAFRGPLAVRTGLNVVGYNMALNTNPIPEKDHRVGRFQLDYNKVSAAVAAGRLDENYAIIPTGKLQNDGIAGKNFLNALEIAITNQQHRGIHWQTLVDKA